MSDINAAPTAADTIPNEIPIPVDSEPASSSIPEFVSETLYIQNLNEKIRIDGSSLSNRYSTHVDHTPQSSSHLYAVSSSRMVRYSMSSRTTTFACVVKHSFHLHLRTLPKKP